METQFQSIIKKGGKIKYYVAIAPKDILKNILFGGNEWQIFVTFFYFALVFFNPRITY